MQLNIAHLYPHSMSTYGDTGNLICLKQRATWRNIEVIIHSIEVGQPIPPKIDLYFFGGGQDAAQASLAEDLFKKGARIKSDIELGIPLLAICGGYQLLGHRYIPFDYDPIPGVGLFPVETKASKDRMIGNLIIEANPVLGLPKNLPQTIVGFENHSGKTSLIDSQSAFPLGYVKEGYGNNGTDKTEGCVYRHAVGCYLHGSLLPKNPQLADWLLDKALTNKDSGFTLTALDDQLEWSAHSYIVGRYIER